MASLQNIDSPVWALSLYGYGVVVEGLAAIRQRIDIAIRTTKGTDPMRPLFGTRIFEFVDMPESVAIPNIKREILEALEIWVPEIKVNRITHYFKKPHNPEFEITYTVKDEDLLDKVVLDLGAQSMAADQITDFVLQAFYPANPKGYRYSVQLERNGNLLNPKPNPAGFATLTELFEWVRTNWAYAGRWHMAADKIVCYMKAEGVKSASLSISVLPIVQFSAAFPELNPGENYRVSYKENGVEKLPAMPENYNNPGAVLSFARNNWPGVSWLVEFLQADGEATFSDEFGPEFGGGPVRGYNLIGVSNVEGFAGELTITKA